MLYIRRLSHHLLIIFFTLHEIVLRKSRATLNAMPLIPRYFETYISTSDLRCDEEGRHVAIPKKQLEAELGSGNVNDKRSNNTNDTGENSVSTTSLESASTDAFDYEYVGDVFEDVSYSRNSDDNDKSSDDNAFLVESQRRRSIDPSFWDVMIHNDSIRNLGERTIAVRNRSDESGPQENNWRKLVHFAGDTELIDRDHDGISLSKDFSKVLDIYNEAMECPDYDEKDPNIPYSRADFCKALYSDEIEAGQVEWDSKYYDEYRPDEIVARRIKKKFLKALGASTLSVALSNLAGKIIEKLLNGKHDLEDDLILGGEVTEEQVASGYLYNSGNAVESTTNSKAASIFRSDDDTSSIVNPTKRESISSTPESTRTEISQTSATGESTSVPASGSEPKNTTTVQSVAQAMAISAAGVITASVALAGSEVAAAAGAATAATATAGSVVTGVSFLVVSNDFCTSFTPLLPVPNGLSVS